MDTDKVIFARTPAYPTRQAIELASFYHAIEFESTQRTLHAVHPMELDCLYALSKDEREDLYWVVTLKQFGLRHSKDKSGFENALSRTLKRIERVRADQGEDDAGNDNGSLNSTPISFNPSTNELHEDPPRATPRTTQERHTQSPGSHPHQYAEPAPRPARQSKNGLPKTGESGSQGDVVPAAQLGTNVPELRERQPLPYPAFSEADRRHISLPPVRANTTSSSKTDANKRVPHYTSRADVPINTANGRRTSSFEPGQQPRSTFQHVPPISSEPTASATPGGDTRPVHSAEPTATSYVRIEPSWTTLNQELEDLHRAPRAHHHRKLLDDIREALDQYPLSRSPRVRQAWLDESQRLLAEATRLIVRSQDTSTRGSPSLESATRDRHRHGHRKSHSSISRSGTSNSNRTASSRASHSTRRSSHSSHTSHQRSDTRPRASTSSMRFWDRPGSFTEKFKAELNENRKEEAERKERLAREQRWPRFSQRPGPYVPVNIKGDGTPHLRALFGWPGEDLVKKVLQEGTRNQFQRVVLDQHNSHLLRRTKGQVGEILPFSAATIMGLLEYTPAEVEDVLCRDNLKMIFETCPELHHRKRDWI